MSVNMAAVSDMIEVSDLNATFMVAEIGMNF